MSMVFMAICFVFVVNKMRVYKLLILCLAIKIVHCSPTDTFHEELYLKHLASGQLYAHFQFTITWNSSLGEENACMFALKYGCA